MKPVKCAFKVTGEDGAYWACGASLSLVFFLLFANFGLIRG